MSGWTSPACSRRRSEAQSACRGGKVDVNGQAAKPHRTIRPGDQIRITRPSGRRQIVVVRTLADRHIPKADAKTLYDDLTPPPAPEEVEMRRLARIFHAVTQSHPGRAPDQAGAACAAQAEGNRRVTPSPLGSDHGRTVGGEAATRRAERPTRPPFQVIAKPAGPRCNLHCTYCFYLEKDRLYPDSWRMPDEVLESYIRQYPESQDTPAVSFSWQGGEPTLLGVAFFELVVELQRRYAAGRTIENAFQTNGVLLDEQWGAFLAREQVPGRALHRRTAASARPLPRRPRRRPDVRPRRARARPAPAPRRGVQHADVGQSRQRPTGRSRSIVS